MEAPFTLTGAQPAAPVVAGMGGRLHLRVDDGVRVEVGEELGTVGAGGDPHSLVALEEALDLLNGSTAPDITAFGPVSTSDLPGPLQPPYASLMNALEGYGLAADTTQRDSTLRRLRAAREYHQDMAARQDSVNVTLRLEVELAADLLERQILAGELGGSPRAREVERRQEVARARRALQLGQMEARRLEQATREAGSAVSEYVRRWERELAEARQELAAAEARLRAAVAEWREAALLLAPVAGRVALFDYAGDGLHVSRGDTVLAVVPAGGEPVARVELSARRVGRVEVGHDVRLHFDAFPALSFGIVEGRVAGISGAPRSDTYFVMVELVRGLVTDTGNDLPSWSGTVGEAHILTRDRSLLARIVGWGG